MGFSKNPVDIVRDRKLSQGEVADALRLAIMAELDAINLYLQLSRLIDDERVRRFLRILLRRRRLTSVSF
jgi:rubrerythrin